MLTWGNPAQPCSVPAGRDRALNPSPLRGHATTRCLPTTAHRRDELADKLSLPSGRCAASRDKRSRDRKTRPSTPALIFRATPKRRKRRMILHENLCQDQIEMACIANIWGAPYRQNGFASEFGRRGGRKIFSKFLRLHPIAPVPLACPGEIRRPFSPFP